MTVSRDLQTLADTAPREPWVAIQRNPTSGSGKRAALLLDLIRNLRRLGLRPRLYSDRTELDAAVRDPARRDRLHAIVAAGGDGTLLDLLNRHPDIPIAPFPLGTENLVSRHLRFPLCGRTMAETIAAGKTRLFDAARINGRRFLIMASVGFDAAVLHRTHQQRRGHISRWSYAAPIVSELADFDPPRLRVSVDGQPAAEGEIVVVGNLPSYAMDLPLVPSADGHDGLLDVRVIEARSVPALVQEFLAVLFNPAGTNPRHAHLRGRRITIESDRPVPIQADGDPIGTTPAEITVEPSSIRLIVS